MLSSVELNRLVSEWRIRFERIKAIIAPPEWKENDWRDFSLLLTELIKKHGTSWIVDPIVYWDLRWKLQDGGELICQVEHVPGERASLIVAQTGGFATEVDSYTWLWAEFAPDGSFARDPYWVEGTWKEALMLLIMPYNRRVDFYLGDQAKTPDALLLQEGARPNTEAAGTSVSMIQ